jgi:hypothetical protein
MWQWRSVPQGCDQLQHGQGVDHGLTGVGTGDLGHTLVGFLHGGPCCCCGVGWIA